MCPDPKKGWYLLYFNAFGAIWVKVMWCEFGEVLAIFVPVTNFLAGRTLFLSNWHLEWIYVPRFHFTIRLGRAHTSGFSWINVGRRKYFAITTIFITMFEFNLKFQSAWRDWPKCLLDAEAQVTHTVFYNYFFLQFWQLVPKISIIFNYDNCC